MAALIGTRSRARSIQKWFNDHRDNWYDAIPPKGWKKVGSGGTRIVYLHEESGVVYKVCSYRHEDYDNHAELENARSLYRRVRNNDQWWGAYVRIPKTSGFSFEDNLVVAMEYIEGLMGYQSPDNSSQRAREELHSVGFSDMHGKNYIVDKDGTHWPIDMGSPLPGHPEYTAPDRRCLNANGGW